MIMKRGNVVVVSMVAIFCVSLAMAEEAGATEAKEEEDPAKKKLLQIEKWESEGKEHAKNEIRYLAILCVEVHGCVQEQNHTFHGPSLTLENVKEIHEKIRQNLTKRLEVHRFERLKALEFIVEAQKRVADTQNMIDHYGLYENGDAAKFMKLMANQDISGNEEVIQIIRKNIERILDHNNLTWSEQVAKDLLKTIKGRIQVKINIQKEKLNKRKTQLTDTESHWYRMKAQVDLLDEYQSSSKDMFEMLKKTMDTSMRKETFVSSSSSRTLDEFLAEEGSISRSSSKFH